MIGIDNRDEVHNEQDKPISKKERHDTDGNALLFALGQRVSHH
jgi:hypothetical protein